MVVEKDFLGGYLGFQLFLNVVQESFVSDGGCVDLCGVNFSFKQNESMVQSIMVKKMSFSFDMNLILKNMRVFRMSKMSVFSIWFVFGKLSWGNVNISILIEFKFYVL